MAAAPTMTYIALGLAAASSLAVNLYAESVTREASMVVDIVLTATVTISCAAALFAFDVSWRHWIVAMRSARRVSIDLLRLDSYHCYASHLTMLMGFGVIQISALRIIPLLERGYEDLYRQLLAGSITLFVVTFAVWIFPLWVLHGRIRDAKSMELSTVDRAMAGDMDAMSTSRIRDYRSEFSFPDLISYQSHVRSLNTWPVSTYAQRFVLIGLLPPFTWVMAALVESLLETYW
jgi:hypothetical protein